MIISVRGERVSYQTRIQSDMHASYPGLKSGTGLLWLDETLVRLNGLGYTKLVKNVLGSMKEIDRLPGFLLELNLVDCLLKAGLDSAKVLDEHCVGGLSQPADATYEDPPHRRADFQCKYVNSYYNELVVNQLTHWIDSSFTDVEPGAHIELGTNTEVDDKSLGEFKRWFSANIGGLAYGTTETFTDSRGKGQVFVEKKPSKEKGIHVGVLQAPVPPGSFAVKEDIPKARQAVKRRYSKAVSTFAYHPAPAQQNFLVMDIDALSMLSERQVYYALYGQDSVPRSLPGGGYEMVNDGLGLYALGELDRISAVVLLTDGPLGVYDAAVFPHPSHEAGTEFWLGLPQFRRGEPRRRPR